MSRLGRASTLALAESFIVSRQAPARRLAIVGRSTPASGHREEDSLDLLMATSPQLVG